MGQSANLNAVFGTATMLIAIPTGVKISTWLAAHHVPRPDPLRGADALLDGLHRALRRGRAHRRPARQPRDRLSGAQLAVSGRAFPQHADPGPALRDARRLSLLVPQGLRFPAQRGLGADRLRELGDRLPARLHAALRARRARDAAAHGGIFRAGLSALDHRSRGGGCLRAGGAREPLRAALRQHPRPRENPRLRRRSVGTGARWNGRPRARRRNTTTR